MTSMRAVLSGVAVLSLVGAAGIARADDHRFRPDVERHAAQDGRGDTSDARAMRVAVDRPATERFAPQHQAAPQFKESRATPPMKGEYQVRFGEQRDESVSLPGAAAKPDAMQDAVAASRKANPSMRSASKPPMKNEILNRLAESNDGGAAAEAPQARAVASAPKKNMTRLQGLGVMPIKSDVKMRVHEHSDDEM